MFINDITKYVAIIEIKGLDSRKYLQGQLTNDINQLDDKSFQLSAHLDNKGRILGSFIITKLKNEDEDHYLLLTAKEMSDTLLSRLKMFVLRSKVEISQSDKHVLFSSQQLNFPNVIQLNNTYFIAIVDNPPVGYEEHASEWHNFLINNGYPVIYKKTQGLFIPQQVNFDLFNGINFKKGCYTGQEIVARTHYLGKIKRRMFRCISDFSMKAGDPVVSPIMNNQQIGIIVDVVKREYNYMGLVSIQLDVIDEAYLDIENQKQLLLQPLTYNS